MYKTFNAGLRGLLDEVIKITYFMRGALQYADAFELTLYEKQMISNFLNKRFKEESKKPTHINRIY